jgi:hypothetical chaperone protein
MQRIYGVDFGTSNSSIALVQPGGVHVLPVDPGAANPAVASSVLYIDRSSRSYIGSEAINLFVQNNTGREIVRKRVSSGEIIETVFGDEYVQFDVDVDIPGRFFQALKTFLKDDSFEGTRVFGRFYTIEELVALMLGQLKERADRLGGDSVDAVVMGRPVRFSDEQRQDELAERRLHRAALNAGFREVRFLYEPIGAALSFEADLTRETLAFVFDFGGGTLDFTVIRLSPEQALKSDRLDDILAVGGLVIGGNTFDEDIMEKRLMKYLGTRSVGKTMTGTELQLPRWIAAQLRSWYTIPLLNERNTIKTIKELAGVAIKRRKDLLALLTLIQKNYGWDLFQEIERAKITLSDQLETAIRFQKENIRIDENMTRLNLEAIISKRLRAIDMEVDKTIRSAGLAASDIDVVLRTGGSSLIPAVQGLLEAKFGRDKVNRQEVFTSVVKGLALAGHSRFF